MVIKNLKNTKIMYKMNARITHLEQSSSQPPVNGHAFRGESCQAFDSVFCVQKLSVALLLDIKAVVYRYFDTFRNRHLGQSKKGKESELICETKIV